MKPEMVKLQSIEDWGKKVRASGAKMFIVEECDRMVYASNKDKSIIYGNWSIDAKFGWHYAIPIRWSTRWRKFKKL